MSDGSPAWEAFTQVLMGLGTGVVVAVMVAFTTKWPRGALIILGSDVALISAG